MADTVFDRDERSRSLSSSPPRSLRVLHTIAAGDPAGGGPIEGIRQLANAMGQLGVETEVLTVDDPSDSPWNEAFPSKVHAMGPGKGKFGASARFESFLAEHGGEYDAIVCNGLWQFSNLAVWKTRHRHGRPYLVFNPGCSIPGLRGRTRSRTSRSRRTGFWASTAPCATRAPRCTPARRSVTRRRAHSFPGVATARGS